MIKLSAQQREELIRLTTSSALDFLSGRRALGLLHLDEGMSVVQVSKALRVSEQSVYNWIERFNCGDDEGDNVKGLYVKDYSRDGDLTKEQEEQLRVHFSQNIAMRIQEVIEYILSNFGVEYSRSGAINLMHRIGFHYSKPIHMPKCSSAEEQRQFIEAYKELRDNLPEDAAILFADAVHPTHQSKPSCGWIYGEDKVALPANSGRQRVNILGAVNLRDGKYNHVADLTINADSVIKLIINLQVLYPNMKIIHLFVDNAKIFYAKMVKEWMTENNSRVVFHYLPAYCPHLNPIERLWGVMHKNVTHNKYYSKFNEFSKTILDFLKFNINNNWNKYKSSITDNFRVIEYYNFKLIG